MKYRESKKPDGILQDPQYEDIINSIDVDFTQFDGIPDTESLFIVFRSILFDNIARDYINQYPEATIVSFGSGLDFRFDRLDNGRIQWFDVELPEVIELRNKLFPETDRAHPIAASVPDYSWAGLIPHDGRMLFLAEGLFMYLDPEQAKNLVIYLSDTFPGSMLLFDVCSTWCMENWQASPHPYKRKMGGLWKWTSEGRYDIENWDPRIRVISEWMPMHLLSGRNQGIRELLDDLEIPDYIKEQVMSQVRICLIRLEYKEHAIHDNRLNPQDDVLNRQDITKVTEEIARQIMGAPR